VVVNFLKKLWSKFLTLKVWQKALVVLLLVSFVGALTGTSETSKTPNSTAQSQPVSPEPVEKSTLDLLDEYSVDWNNYSPTVKQRIAELVDAADCTNLQNEFDNADSNNEAQRNRTGESNADLMSLLDDQMKKIGCY